MPVLNVPSFFSPYPFTFYAEAEYEVSVISDAHGKKTDT
jgi:hypothetical protein